MAAAVRLRMAAAAAAAAAAFLFTKDEKALAFHGPLIYECSIVESVCREAPARRRAPSSTCCTTTDGTLTGTSGCPSRA